MGSPILTRAGVVRGLKARGLASDTSRRSATKAEASWVLRRRERAGFALTQELPGVLPQDFPIPHVESVPNYPLSRDRSSCWYSPLQGTSPK